MFLAHFQLPTREYSECRYTPHRLDSRLSLPPSARLGVPASALCGENKQTLNRPECINIREITLTQLAVGSVHLKYEAEDKDRWKHMSGVRECVG